MRLASHVVLAALLLPACDDGGLDSADATPERDASTAGDSAIDTAPVRSGSSELTDGTSTWRLDGLGIDAPNNLVSISGHNAFWFAWSVFNPGTELFGGDRVREADIVGDGTCGVPCDEILPGCPGRDCIPPLDSPTMVSETPSYLADSDMVMGVITPEGPRAYPHNILWWHEVVNEEIGGEAFSVTFCPLTGSGLRFDRRGFVPDETVRLGVSGLLYNSNLVLWDRETETLWSQMRIEGVQGDHLGTPAPVQPVFEMTWRAWRTLHPDTLVISEDTGHSRDYTRYPYTRGGDYRTNHADTFRTTNPPPDEQFANKDMVFGLTVGELRRGYVWNMLRDAVGGSRGVVNDRLGDVPVAIVFDLDESYVHAFDRRISGTEAELTLVPTE